MRNMIKLSAIIAVLIFFTCCKKESKDFRDKYTGNWDFVVEVTKLNIDSIGQYERDTIYYLGKISNGNADNELNIQYSKDSLIVLNIIESGELSIFPTQYSNGEFEGESKIHLYLRWGGLGGNTTHVIDGVKK